MKAPPAPAVLSGIEEDFDVVELLVRCVVALQFLLGFEGVGFVLFEKHVHERAGMGDMYKGAGSAMQSSSVQGYQMQNKVIVSVSA